jgi:hypothetical protein
MLSKYPALTLNEFKKGSRRALEKARKVERKTSYVKKGAIWSEVVALHTDKGSSQGRRQATPRVTEKSLDQEEAESRQRKVDGSELEARGKRSLSCSAKVPNVTPVDLEGQGEDTLNEEGDSKEEHVPSTSSGIVEDGDSNRPHKCKFCGKGYQKIGMLLKHVETKHSQQGEPSRLDCPHCSKTFKNHTTLKKHQLIHSRVNSFICDICAMDFPSQYKLNVHTRHNHTLLSCGVADCDFEGSASELFQHRHNKHQSGAQHVDWTCEICGKNYKSRKGVYKHKKNHEKLDALNSLDQASSSTDTPPPNGTNSLQNVQDPVPHILQAPAPYNPYNPQPQYQQGEHQSYSDNAYSMQFYSSQNLHYFPNTQQRHHPGPLQSPQLYPSTTETSYKSGEGWQNVNNNSIPFHNW